MAQHELHLVIPATHDDVLMARMAMSGLGMLSGLDVELIGDLRTVTNECCDCLMGRTRRPQKLEIRAGVSEGRLTADFSAVGETDGEGQPTDREMAYGIRSTLMPEVTLHEDEKGIVQITCSMPAGGDGHHE